MKDRFEAKLILFIIPALVVWELLYQFVILKLFPGADNSTVHGLGFVILVGIVWVIYRRRQGEEEDQEKDA